MDPIILTVVGVGAGVVGAVATIASLFRKNKVSVKLPHELISAQLSANAHMAVRNKQRGTER
jgi:hypothetical protein